LPIAFDLTGGQAADSPHFETLMDLDPDVRSRVIVADKAYDSANNRQRTRERGSLTVIPYRKNAKNRPKWFARALYRGRTRMEQAFANVQGMIRLAEDHGELCLDVLCAEALDLDRFASGFVIEQFRNNDDKELTP